MTVFESKHMKMMLSLFNETNGREPTDVEKATIKFYLDGSEEALPDFMGFKNRTDLNKFLKGIPTHTVPE